MTFIAGMSGAFLILGTMTKKCPVDLTVTANVFNITLVYKVLIVRFVGCCEHFGYDAVEARAGLVLMNVSLKAFLWVNGGT